MAMGVLLRQVLLFLVVIMIGMQWPIYWNSFLVRYVGLEYLYMVLIWMRIVPLIRKTYENDSGIVDWNPISPKTRETEQNQNVVENVISTQKGMQSALWASERLHGLTSFDDCVFDMNKRVCIFVDFISLRIHVSICVILWHKSNWVRSITMVSLSALSYIGSKPQ